MPTRRGADIAQRWYGLNAVAALLALAYPVVAPGLSVAGATDAPTGVAASPTWYACDDGLAPSPALPVPALPILWSSVRWLKHWRWPMEAGRWSWPVPARAPATSATGT